MATSTERGPAPFHGNALAITVDRATTSRTSLSPDGFLHESLINIAILLNQVNEAAEKQNQAQADGWQ
jgi:hypothetical protein